MNVDILRIKVFFFYYSEREVKLGIWLFVYIGEIFLVLECLLMLSFFKVDHHLPLGKSVDECYTDQHNCGERTDVGLDNLLTINIELHTRSKYITRLQVRLYTEFIFRHIR